jgi:hypothetical protein
MVMVIWMWAAALIMADISPEMTRAVNIYLIFW